MKKLFFAALAAFTICFSAQAQDAKKFYIAPSIGYALGAQTSALGVTNTSAQNNSNMDKANYGTLGNAFLMRLNGGWNINENFALELGFGYAAASKTTINESRFGKTTAKANQFFLQNSVVVGANVGKVRIYTKAGFIIPLSVKTVIEDASSQNASLKQEVKYSTPLGFTGALGIEIPMGSLSFFGELGHTSLNIRRKSATITELKVSGIDRLPDLSNSDKNIDYVTSNPQNSNSPNVNSQELATKDPFSNFSINIGVKIGL